MRKTMIAVILIPAVIIGGVIIAMLFSARSDFDGNRVNGPGYYCLEFRAMNGSDTQVWELQKGAVLSVSYEITSGRVSLIIGKKNEKPVFRGNGIDQGDFLVEIPEDGAYIITVEAGNARGKLLVKLA